MPETTPAERPKRPDHPDTLSWPVSALPLPLSVTEFADRCAQLSAEHGPDLVTWQSGSHMIVATPGVRCECGTCVHATASRIAELTTRPSYALSVGMVLCPDCGNKRCPAAWHHDYVCTRSNEPDQAPTVAPGRPDPRL